MVTVFAALAFAPAAAATGQLAIGPGGDVALLQDDPAPLVGAVGPFGATPRPFVRLRGGRVYEPQVVVTESGEAVAAWETQHGAMTATAPRGGRFGKAVSLGAHSSDPALAVEPGGGVLLAWTGAGRRPQVATRPPGGRFGERVAVSGRGGAVEGLGVDSHGNALLLTTHLERGFAFQVQARDRPAGGSFGQAVTISGTDKHAGSTAALAVAPNGRALVLWSNATDLVTSVRAPGEPFGAPMPVTDRQCSTHFVGGTVGIADDGYAVVAWDESGSGDYAEDVGDGCSNTSRRAETQPDGRFGRPIELASPMAPAWRPAVAVDGAGNAVVAAGDPRFRVTVRYRTAGEDYLGAPTDIAGPLIGGLPSVALDPAGRALVAWSQNDGERVRVKLRTVPGAARARTVGTRASYARGRRSNCFPPGSKTVLQTRTSRVFKLKPGRRTKYACYFRRGKRIALDFGFDDFPVTTTAPPAMALNGPLLATVESSAVCGACSGYDLLEVYDLRTGDEANGYAPDGPPGRYGFDSMVLSRHASLAWASCSGTRCPGKEIGRVWAYPAGTVSPKLIDKGTGIDPESLRLRGTTLSWVRDGVRRRTTLAP